MEMHRKEMLNLCRRGQGLGGQGSQMKQIKGEPWPPEEVLAARRDGIQMEDHGRGIHSYHAD